MKEEKTRRLYFTSDIHGDLFPTDYRSTEERDAGLFKCANRFKKDGNTLIIDGGDLLQGSPLDAFQHDSEGSASPVSPFRGGRSATRTSFLSASTVTGRAERAAIPPMRSAPSLAE